MRFRNREVCDLVKNNDGDFFPEVRRVFFLHYMTKGKAKIGVPGYGFKIVPLSQLKHREEVAA